MTLRAGITEAGWDLLVQTAVPYIQVTVVIFFMVICHLAMTHEKKNIAVAVEGPLIRCHC